MLHEWLQRPHVAEWWRPTPSFEEVGLLQGYIALHGDRAIGFIQSYVVKDCGDGWWEDETDPGARGIDQFLAHGEDLGRGLGTAMIRAFVARLFDDPSVTDVQTDPEPRNARAIRCYEKAGFRVVREVNTPDGPALLMICTRPALGSGA
jgi:RimJ/RimL family protein N-acetyltransferase